MMPLSTTSLLTRALAGLLLVALAACNRGEERAKGGLAAQQATIVSAGNDSAALPGTPMQDRVAVIGLLNKRNGQTRDLVMKPGMALRVGDAIVRLRACEASAPWENIPETGAFVQLDTRSAADGKWRRTFSGWLFRERPERNVVQHPIFDVWVRECRMRWPETGPDTQKVGGKGNSAGASNATDAAIPDPAPQSNASAPD